MSDIFVRRCSFNLFVDCFVYVLEIHSLLCCAKVRRKVLTRPLGAPARCISAVSRQIHAVFHFLSCPSPSFLDTKSPISTPPNVREEQKRGKHHFLLILGVKFLPRSIFDLFANAANWCCILFELCTSTCFRTCCFSSLTYYNYFSLAALRRCKADFM